MEQMVVQEAAALDIIVAVKEVEEQEILHQYPQLKGEMEVVPYQVVLAVGQEPVVAEVLEQLDLMALELGLNLMNKEVLEVMEFLRQSQDHQ